MATILMVDDSAYTRPMHCRILETAGHTVAEASTGMGAIESYFLSKPDLVLLDLSMEDLGGLDVLGKLREINAEVAAIVISADVQRSTEQLVAQAGAKRFLAKPVSPELLIGAISDVLAEKVV